MSSGNSHDLRASYGAYKLATNCFLGWMVAQYRSAVPARGDDDSGPIQSTGDIVRIATVLKESQTIVPLSIIGALGHAIDKRREVLEIYKALGAEDPSHKHFIKRLEETSDILTPLVAESKLPTSEIPGIDTVTLNQFAALALEEGDTDADDDDDDAPLLPTSSKLPTATHRRSAKGKVILRQPHAKLEVFLEDDEMCRVFEVAYLLHEAGKMRDQLMMFWAEAGKGMIPIPVAAWLTSTVFCLTNQLIADRFPLTSDEMEKTCNNVFDFLEAQPEIDNATDGQLNIVRFCDFRKFVNDWSYNRDQLGRGGDLTTDGKYDEEHFRGVLEILQNTRTYYEEFRPVERLELHNITDSQQARSSEPVLDYLKNFHLGLLPSPSVEEHAASTESPEQTASTDSADDASTELVFGMDLLITTFDAFRWPDGKLNEDVDARTRALDLAYDIGTAVDDSLKVLQDSLNYAPGATLVEEMRELLRGLFDYADERSSFYYRAPWTAGAHMGEILFQAQYFGRYLAGSNSHTGLAAIPATLHLYNTLRRSDFNLAEIPIMEEFCNLFKANVFQGDLPDKNFLSIYRRIVFGGTLNKNKSAIECGNKKCIVPPLMSTFFEQHGNHHRMGPKCLARFLGESNPTTKAQEEKIVKKAVSQPITAIMQRAKETVIAEFSSPVPVMRINYFAIFNLCIEVLENFSKIIDGSELKGSLKFSPPVELHAIRGVSMVDYVLEIIAEYSKTHRNRKKLPKLDWPTFAARAFNVIDKDATLEQFLWKV
ncbi:hypothetical protein BDP81DRAFT_517686 [Colletotrichum phormii]|uniref:DUF6604 domain-containing protein n=1 Tax=Colletotrichum phormii TaxID=359342 RepID=A0AAI9ZTF5_9PEZI|nr:uncharacterized protein BDP81DRAFT_517686 [Colletotrichum phormii]KAK1637846.1 hypothetical protein BDP81DRAFT_517686 [Colletotrichum phormii]